MKAKSIRAHGLWDFVRLQNNPKDVLNSGTWEYAALGSQKDVADVSRLGILWGGYPVAGWARCDHRGPCKRETEGRLTTDRGRGRECFCCLLEITG